MVKLPAQNQDPMAHTRYLDFRDVRRLRSCCLAACIWTANALLSLKSADMRPQQAHGSAECADKTRMHIEQPLDKAPIDRHTACEPATAGPAKDSETRSRSSEVNAERTVSGPDGIDTPNVGTGPIGSPGIKLFCEAHNTSAKNIFAGAHNMSGKNLIARAHSGSMKSVFTGPHNSSGKNVFTVAHSSSPRTGTPQNPSSPDSASRPVEKRMLRRSFLSASSALSFDSWYSPTDKQWPFQEAHTWSAAGTCGLTAVESDKACIARADVGAVDWKHLNFGQMSDADKAVLCEDFFSRQVRGWSAHV
jgi:hypothetical protein